MSIEQMKVIAKFEHVDTGAPLTDQDLRVRFYDADLMSDDYLGESRLDEHGCTEVTFEASKFQSGVLGKLWDRLKEQKPDIFCEVIDRDGQAIYRSSVRWNVDPGSAAKFAAVDLGTYAFSKGAGLSQPMFYGGLNRPLY